MNGWRGRLKFDPTSPLLASRGPALNYFVRRDLLDEKVGSVEEEIWELLEARKIVASQLGTGAWRYRAGRQHIRSSEDYNQLETYRLLRELIEKYGFNKSHVAIRRAATFLFAHQSGEGDFRGICGNQYVPYYSAAMMELLIKAGYSGDRRIERGFRWLLSIRQDDGGWAFPLRTVGRKLDPQTFRDETIQPDRTRPFSHLITGMVLRAFAAHSERRKSAEAKAAGELLASRFFKPDKYPDRRAASFWTGFSFPFWFTDLLSSLDSLSWIGSTGEDGNIRRALDWFVARQRENGLWELQLRIMSREKNPNEWLTLAISRVFKRFYGIVPRSAG